MISARLTLGFASIAHSYAHLATLLYATVVLVLEREFSLPFAELAWLSLPGFVLFGAGALPAGWLGDRWSAAGMLVVYFLGLGGALCVTGLATSPLGLLVGLTLVGLFASIYHPVGLAWLVRNAVNRGRALGINGVFGSLGTALAAVVAGALADLLGWRAAFIVPGLLCVLIGVAFAVAMGRGLISDAATDVRPDLPAQAADVRRAFGVLLFTILCTGMIFQATAVGLPKLFSERLPSLAGEGAFGAGLMVSLVYLSAGAAQIVGGELADRYPPKMVYVFCQMLQLPMLVLALVSHNPLLVVAAALMVSLNLAATPAENVLLARYTPEAWRGRAFGVKFLLALGVSAFGVSLVPAIHGLTGSLDGLLLALMLFAGASGLVATLLPPERAPVAAPNAAE
jgi:MFS family permease